MKKILPIQYLRAIAALMVIAYHAPATLTANAVPISYLRGGVHGVDIFFVISGFIMATTATSRRLSVMEFIVKRLIRIAPLYWFVTFCTTILVLLKPHLFRSTVVDPVSLVKSLLFIPYYSAAFPGNIWPVVVPGWTLNYEMFFYVIFALCISLASRSRVMTITGIFIILVCIGLCFNVANPIYATYTDSLLIEFILGMWVAEFHRAGRLPTPLFAWVLIIGGYGLLCMPDSTFRGFTKGLPAAAIVFGALVTLRGLNSKLLERLGDASYAIYLTQYFVFGVLRTAWGAIGADSNASYSIPIYVLMALIGASLVGVGAHLAVEKPITRWLTGLLLRQNASAHVDIENHLFSSTRGQVKSNRDMEIKETVDRKP